MPKTEMTTSELFSKKVSLQFIIAKHEGIISVAKEYQEMIDKEIEKRKQEKKELEI